MKTFKRSQADAIRLAGMMVKIIKVGKNSYEIHELIEKGDEPGYWYASVAGDYPKALQRAAERRHEVALVQMGVDPETAAHEAHHAAWAGGSVRQRVSDSVHRLLASEEYGYAA